MIQAFRRSSVMPIGVDVGAHGVRLLQLAGGSNGLTVVAAEHQPLPAGLTIKDEGYHTRVADALQTALGRGGFKGRRVVSTLPAAAVGVKSVRMPPMPGPELAGAVQFEAAERMPSDRPRIVQHLKAGEVRQGDDVRQEVLLLAADEAFIEAHVAALASCNLRPLAIDSIPTALTRVVSTRADLHPRGGEAPAKVVIDAGHGSTKVLVARGGRVVFFKMIELGGAALDKAVARALKLPLPEAAERRQALAGSDAADQATGGSPATAAVLDALRPTLTELGREIALCLRYYGVTFRGARPLHALLVGGLGGDTVLMNELAKAAGLELRRHDPLAAIDPGPAARAMPAGGAAWAVAAGLSLRGGRRETDGPVLLDPGERAREPEPEAVAV